MNRAQRGTHRWVWWILGPLLLGAVAWAVVDRWVYPVQTRVESGE